MIYNVSVRNGNSTKVIPCRSYTVREVTEDMPAVKQGIDQPGVYLDLIPGGEQIILPRDGTAIFVASDESRRTIAKYTWPIEEKSEKRGRHKELRNLAV